MTPTEVVNVHIAKDQVISLVNGWAIVELRWWGCTGGFSLIGFVMVMGMVDVAAGNLFPRIALC